MNQEGIPNSRSITNNVLQRICKEIIVQSRSRDYPRRAQKPFPRARANKVPPSEAATVIIFNPNWIFALQPPTSIARPIIHNVPDSNAEN